MAVLRLSTKAALRRLHRAMNPFIPSDENMDVRIIGAIMDELAGDAPEGTSDAIEARQHARTGYTFPHNKELREMMMQNDGIGYKAYSAHDRV